MRVVVLGAGVVGLFAAHALAHRGREVEVLSRDDPLATTSAVAGASFKPRLVDDSADLRVLLRASGAILAGWARSGFADTLGIRRHRHVVATARPHPETGHLDLLEGVTHLAPHDLPPGARSGVAFSTWFFPAEVTVAALVDHLAADHDVVVHRGVVSRLDDLAGTDQAVVNATGAAAGALADDPAVVPVRGRVVRVRSPLVASGEDGSVSVDGVYVYPRHDGVLVGGTTEWGAADTRPDPAATRRLVDAATPLLPALADVDGADLEPLAGLRPHRRGGVRVAADTMAGSPVVHAYGHGGAGWTLAPGTGERVADLVDHAAG